MRGITLVLLWIIAIIIAVTMTVVAAATTTAGGGNCLSTEPVRERITTTTGNQPNHGMATSARQNQRTPVSRSCTMPSSTATRKPNASSSTPLVPSSPMSVKALPLPATKMEYGHNETAVAPTPVSASASSASPVDGGMPSSSCSVDHSPQAGQGESMGQFVHQWNDFGSWPPLGLIGIALFTAFALVAHPDGLAWVLLGKINAMFQVTVHILREFQGSLLGRPGPGFLSAVFAAATLAGLALLLFAMIDNVFSRRFTRRQRSGKHAPSPAGRKKKKRRNNNPRHKSKAYSDQTNQQLAAVSETETDSVSSDSGQRSFAETETDADDVHIHVTSKPSNGSPVPPAQQLSPSTESSPAKQHCNPIFQQNSDRIALQVPFQSIPTPNDHHVTLRTTPTHASSSHSSRSNPQNDTATKHPETVSIPNANAEDVFADDHSCESSLSSPSLGNSQGHSVSGSSKRSEKGGRSKKERRTKNQQVTNAAQANRQQEKNQRIYKGPKTGVVSTGTIAAAEPPSTPMPLVPFSRWDALKPSSTNGANNTPNSQSKGDQLHQPSPRHHQTPRGNGYQQHQNQNQNTYQNLNQHTPRKSTQNHPHHQQTPQSNMRRGGNKKSRNAALNNPRHKSSTTSPPTNHIANSPISKRVVQKLPTPAPTPSFPLSEQLAPFPNTPCSTTATTPSTLAPPPGLTRSTPSDDFFDPVPALSPLSRYVVNSSLMIPETSFVTDCNTLQPNVIPSSSPFVPCELGIARSKGPAPSFPWSLPSSMESLYPTSPMGLYGTDNDNGNHHAFGGDCNDNDNDDGGIVSDNPFALDEDSRIEADLKELGGQMAGSILDF